MLCGCSTFRRRARKAKPNARCPEPQGTGPIQGDAAQESNSNDHAVVANTPRGAQDIHEEASRMASIEGEQCSNDHVVVANTPRGAQDIHEEANGMAGEQCSNDHVVVANTPRGAQDIHEETDGSASVRGDQRSEEVKLLPKHRIFLSHSGAQKPFWSNSVKTWKMPDTSRSLIVVLKACLRGEKFPALIKDAARRCHVAVVVLSMDYLLSKWPMIELTEFVRAIRQKGSNVNILPLFYKIGVEDLKREHDRVMSVWEERCKTDKWLHPYPTATALRFLSPINGEVFVGDSELAYRRAIVASICKLCPPDVQFDVSAMQGRNRLCDVVVAEFDKLSTEGISSSKWRRSHARVVGVHGIGGAGKTLLCKALCNVYSTEFAGRVLHIELKGYKDFKQENIVEALKLMLESLADARPELLRRISSVEQGDSILRKALWDRHVFLALDNVPEGSTECVQMLLSCLSPRSKAIVTSRSLENLKNVLEGNPIKISGIHGWSTARIPPEKVSFIQVPTLDEDEALRIFLRHALAPAQLVLPFTVEEMEVLKSCIQRCFFLNKDDPGEVSGSRPVRGHYHPLSLQALGSYLKGIDAHHPLQWLHKSKILQERRWFYNGSVFDILRAGYDALPSAKDRLLFLDIAVFAPRGKLNDVHDLCDWLAAIHDMDEEQTLYMMNNLRTKSLIEDWETNTGILKVTVHDLYVDFAEHQIHLEESQRWCVYERNGRNIPSCLRSGPQGRRWSSLVRLKLQTGSVIGFPSEKLREWSNLVVLDINLVQQKSVDLSPLNCLRSLKLKSFILETLTWSDNMQELRCVKLSCERLVREPDFSTCSNLRDLTMRFANPVAICLVSILANTLKVLRLTCCNREFPALLELGSMPSLEVVEIVNNLDFSSGSMVIGGLSSLTHLRRLVLKNLPIRGSIAGLEHLVSLQDLILTRCSALNALPGLGRLSNLQRLDVSGTAIESLPGLENLLQLYGLYLVNCNGLKSLPDLRLVVSLIEVFLVGCTGLSSHPLVPESCTLISWANEGGVMCSWAKFIDDFSLWTQWTDQSSGPKVDFQRVLCHCPASAALEKGLYQYEGLEEVSKAFEEAFLMMHRMAAAGRTKEEFDPKTDLIICAKIVNIIPKYADHLVLRLAGKGNKYHFLLKSSYLRGLLKRHQA